LSKNILIEPMTEKFLLWRCLHYGPISRENIDQWLSESDIDWERYRRRNIPLLVQLTRTYGACAMLARIDENIVGQLRFYPKNIINLKGADGFCLLQDFPNGPPDDFAETEFPPLAQIEDKTLVIHCFMTGSSLQRKNPYQRKGIGTRLVRFLIEWARSQGWERIEVDAFEDLPLIYEITGSAGITFWKKLGFRLINRYPHPYLQEPSDFVEKLEEQAKSIGISPERAKDKIVMGFELR